MSRHVDGDQYEEAAATVVADVVAYEEHDDTERVRRVASEDGDEDEVNVEESEERDVVSEESTAMTGFDDDGVVMDVVVIATAAA